MLITIIVIFVCHVREQTWLLCWLPSVMASIPTGKHRPEVEKC